jgi:hypothetical protein
MEVRRNKVGWQKKWNWDLQVYIVWYQSSGMYCVETGRNGEKKRKTEKL